MCETNLKQEMNCDSEKLVIFELMYSLTLTIGHHMYTKHNVLSPVKHVQG